MDCSNVFLQTWTFPASQLDATLHNGTALVTRTVTSHSHLLTLPIELRMMIWGLLLPDPKVVLAKMRDVTTDEDWENGITNRMQFYLEHHSGQSKPQVPLLSKICQDSRAFLFDHGGFAFGKAGEGGIWWNAKTDMLVIDSTWEDGDFVTQFDGMGGLQHIKHLALNTTQAGDLAYRVVYMAEEINMPRDHRQPLAIELTFRSHSRGCGPTDHFIPRLFTDLEHIMLYFPELNDPGCCRSAPSHSHSVEAGCHAHPTQLISEGSITRKVDINLNLPGEAGMEGAVQSMRQCRQLWVDVNNQHTLVPFHQGGKFYISHAWAWQRGCQFGDELPTGVTRHLITCEEMMEDDLVAL
ncbi:hypothetical protein INS49_003901 [Diaporthe citri]|uniref:uncharacterized protein n=1 Tax=Diaporthe citri TaxID=83186 RepID=UPI001C7F5D34|nr:uncharacterized protein INS49_003901 [Diaporthe citri]KAG6354820.1 hypothetical protein INS49_003901 [Diaporthe citri]